MKELQHPNIIQLIDAFPHKENLHLVFEFMESDLEAVIRDRNILLSPADTKSDTRTGTEPADAPAKFPPKPHTPVQNLLEFRARPENSPLRC